MLYTGAYRFNAGVPSAGGWGRGGYPMVTGTASGAGSNGPGPNGPGSNGETANAPDGGIANVTDVASENWAGYAATGAAGSLTSVSSSWAEPGVSCGATDTFSSFWVGLDGDGTPTVEQTGTEADCADGAASYQGWYEIFPNAPVFFSNPVQPGDAMAEIVAEAPSNGTVLPLADFGTVNFNSSAVDNAPIGDSANLSELTIESSSGAALATPSALTGGNAFSITSDSDGAVTTAPGAGGSGGGGGAAAGTVVGTTTTTTGRSNGMIGQRCTGYRGEVLVEMTERALSGRRIIVLGATGGLGQSVTERFRADGASVLVADARLPADADRQADVDYLTVDALDEASVAAALAKSPPAAAVVNLIGGYTPPQPLSGLDISVLRQQLEVNLVTATIVTKYAMPVLAGQAGGALVHVSSRVAVQNGENGFAYSVSKLGVVRLVEAAAAEGREQGVRVNCIMPSIIDTPANRAAIPGANYDQWPKPAELAAVLAFLVSDDAALISGAAIPVYGRA